MRKCSTHLLPIRSSPFSSGLLPSLVAVMICALALVGPPLRAEEARTLVEIRAKTREQVQFVVDLGIDVWQVEGTRVTAYVSAPDAQALRKAGLELEVLVEDVEGFFGELTAQMVPSEAQYHTYATLVSELYSMEASGVARVYDIGDSIEGRDILAVRVSDYPDVDEGEPAVLLVGCHHAREWISVEVPLFIAQHLVDNYPTDPDIRSLVDNGEIWVVPMLNPDGHQYSVQFNTFWRKNRRDNGDGTFGVDLNRNYANNWGGAGSSGYSGSENFRGVAPFSEPETQALRDLFVDPDRDFRAVISYHSFGQLVLFPWGYTYERAPDHYRFDLIARGMKERIRDVHGRNYIAGPANILYLAAGILDDWAYDMRGIPSYTIELRPLLPLLGVFLPPSEILPTAEENLPAALYLIGLTQNDDDGDGVAESQDNCPGVYNPGQEDEDGDRVGAACDCNDADPGVNPGVEEVCSYLVDEDCDGLVDGDDPDCGPPVWSVAQPAAAFTARSQAAPAGPALNLICAFLVAAFFSVGWKVLRRRSS